MNDEIAPIAGTVLVPYVGELVDLAEPAKVALALETVRDMKRALDEARQELEAALRAESERQGTRTLHLGDIDAVITGGVKVAYDAEKLATRLLAAGLPPERVAELVVMELSYRVDQRVARSVAASNPAYAAAIEQCREVMPAPWRVSIKRGGKR